MRRALTRLERDLLWKHATWILAGDPPCSDDQEGWAPWRDVFALLDDIGWGESADRERFELTLPDDQLQRVLVRIADDARARLNEVADAMQRGYDELQVAGICARIWADDVDELVAEGFTHLGVRWQVEIRDGEVRLVAPSRTFSADDAQAVGMAVANAAQRLRARAPNPADCTHTTTRTVGGVPFAECVDCGADLLAATSNEGAGNARG